MEVLAQLTSLCRLNLQGQNLITERGIGQLGGLDSLAFLNIYDCQAEVVRAMRAFLAQHGMYQHSNRFKGLLRVWLPCGGIDMYGVLCLPPVSWPGPEQAHKLLRPRHLH